MTLPDLLDDGFFDDYLNNAAIAADFAPPELRSHGSDKPLHFLKAFTRDGGPVSYTHLTLPTKRIV